MAALPENKLIAVIAAAVAAYEEAEGQALSLEPEATDTRAAEKKA